MGGLGSSWLETRTRTLWGVIFSVKLSHNIKHDFVHDAAIARLRGRSPIVVACTIRYSLERMVYAKYTFLVFFNVTCIPA
jgi:hypothetical protein